MIVRDAAEPDLEAITAIYNEVLRNSTAIFSDQATTVEERRAYWQGRVRQGYPVLVADYDGVVLGFATFGDFRSWPGYRFTVEGTVHIHSSVRRQGAGLALLQELVARARAAGKHVMIAGVDARNEPSLRFLESFGFVRAGHLHEVGFKFDRFLDLIFLEYKLP